MTDKTKIALLEEKLMNNDKAHDEIKCDVKEVKSDIKAIVDKLDKAIADKADKEDVIFLRNVLIVSILVTIFITVIVNLVVN